MKQFPQDVKLKTGFIEAPKASNTVANNCDLEGATHEKSRGRPRKTVGRKRKGGSMGRYPFLASVVKYLDTRRGVVAESTFNEESRKLRYLGRILEELKAKGKISSTDPRLVTRKDIQAFLTLMSEKGLDGETKAKYLQYLGGLLIFFGNPVLETMRREGWKSPNVRGKTIRVLDERSLMTIQQAAETMRGWNGDLARFMVWFYPYTGVRPSELRLAHVEDLNLRTWEFSVRHPKGDGSWGERRTVMVMPPARPAVLRYLEARDAYIHQKGLEKATALMPNCYRRRDEFFSSNALRQIKAEIQRRAGVKFRLKDFRPTFAQTTVDRDSSLLPDVSRILGHSNLATTQKYYAQIRGSTALQRIERAWTSERPEGPKNHLIETEKYLSGYA